MFPVICTVMADAGHQSRRLATCIVERSSAWLGRDRRFSKDYEYRVQTAETMIDVAAIRLIFNRLAPA